MLDAKAEPRGNILGVGVSAISLQDALDHMDGWVRQRTPNYVCVVPSHTLMECYHHPNLRPIYNQSGLTTPDGMPVVWLLRWQGFSGVERVYGPDLMRAVCAVSPARGYRHYLYGGAPGVAEELAERLRQQFPGIQIVGVESPPFRTLTVEEDEAVVGRIRAAAPDIVWVGIGAPKQDIWMRDHLDRLGVPVLVGVGAAFDFLSGRKTQAPRWIQRSGFEWLFRLFQEPGRLWKRYLLNYPLFVVLVILQRLGVLKFPLTGLPARED